MGRPAGHRGAGRRLALVEKDYWVTHVLWALQVRGFEVWFKGGTSLSKGFGLIQRFSEDLDVRIDAGTTGLVMPATSWNNTKAGAVAARNAWFDAIASHLGVPGCSIQRDPSGSDPKARAAAYRVAYPARHGGRLPPAMRPFVLLEVGRARVEPFVERTLSSWVHDHLAAIGQADAFADNRPVAQRLSHPWVTCLEKLDAIATRFDKERDAPTFVRHYEDAAHIVAARDRLPPLDGGLDGLARLLAQADRKPVPHPDHPAFRPAVGARWDEVRAAWEAIAPLFWAPRISLEDACATLRAVLQELSEG